MSKEHLSELKSFFSSSQILSDSKSLEHYGRDWIRYFNPNPLCIVFPKKESEVKDLVKWAQKHKIVLVPSGGRTGLSGSATAENKEVVVSFEKMNRVIEFNEFEETLTVEPGVITQEVQKIAEEKGLFFPISFAAEGSSQVGGNVATNVGGIHVIQYGMMRRWVRGIKVVTGRGDVLKLGRHLIKNSTGYNLMNLFVGSEGTLGFITEITLAFTRRPPAMQVFLIGINQLSDIVEVYSHFKKHISLHAFEMFTNLALDYVLKNGGSSFPLSQKCSFYVVMEIFERDQEKALSIFEKLMSQEKIQDVSISQNSQQAQEIWSLRENISEAISTYQPYKNDVAVRISKLPQFLTEVDELLQKEYPHYKVVWFGHVGDGNLHINILKPKELDSQIFIQECEKVTQLLFSKIQEFEGSISAEHGVGLLKKKYLQYSRNPEEIEYMKELKKVFDPYQILNTGKIFDI